MRTISAKIILSILIISFLVLGISAGLFLGIYSRSLRQSEVLELERLLQDLADFLRDSGVEDYRSREFIGLLEDISASQGVFFSLENREGRKLLIIRPVNVPDFRRRLPPRPEGLFLYGRNPRTNVDPREELTIMAPDSTRGDPRVGLLLPRGTLGNGEEVILSVYRDSRLADAFVRDAAFALLVSALAAMIAGTLAGVLIGRGISRPIGELQRQSDLLARGDLDARVRVSGRDETARLAVSFNSMAEKLEKHIIALRDERDSLRRFLEDASHELRTPLTSILTSAEVIEDRLKAIPGDDTRRLSEMFAGSRRSVLTMKSLIDGLLSLSRIRSGIRNEEPEPTDLATLLRDHSAAVSPGEDAIEVRIEDDCPDVSIDPVSATQLVQNIVSNARNADSRVIRVACRREGKRIRFRIRDDGRGMAAGDLERASRRFFKGERSRGSGLGLAICRQILEVYDSELVLRSPPSDTPEANGFELEFTLPAHFSNN
jgi:signal transduction histidine kinase